MTPGTGSRGHPPRRSLGEKWHLIQSPIGISTEGENAALRLYQEALLQGVSKGARKPTDMSKTSSVTQKPREAPGTLRSGSVRPFQSSPPSILKRQRTSAW